MTALAVALAAFVATHLLMSHPLREPMVARLGTAGFQIVYSLVSFATLGWAVFAFRAAPVGDPLWAVGDGLWIASTLIMLLASILLLGSLVRNPAMVPQMAGVTDQPARGVFAVTRHPMMWSFALWSLAHVLVAPRPAVVVLCIFVALLALVGAAGQDHKKAAIMGVGWRDWVNKTSYWPFGGQLTGRIPWSAIMPGMHALGGGLVVWLVATWAHPILGAGMPAGIWRWF